LLTATPEPLVDSVPFHTWVMLWPEARVHRTVQPLTADVPAFTVTWPWKPPCQELVVLMVALHAPLGGVDGELEGEVDGDVDGEVDGEVDGDVEGCEVTVLLVGGGGGPPVGT
jgi:hypothetical protein